MIRRNRTPQGGMTQGFWILGDYVWNVRRDHVHVKGTRKVCGCFSCDRPLKPGSWSVCGDCWPRRETRPKNSVRLPFKKDFKSNGEFVELLPLDDERSFRNVFGVQPRLLWVEFNSLAGTEESHD